MVPIAILPFQERGRQERGAPARPGAASASNEGDKVTELLFAALVARPAIMLIERQDVRAALDEQALNLRDWRIPPRPRGWATRSTSSPR